MGSQRARLAASVAVLAFAVLGAESAIGTSAAPDVAVTPFAHGFTSNDQGIGPTGLAFDGAGQLIVSRGGDLYRFGPEGGSADDAHLLHRATGSEFDAAVAFGQGGRLYATRWTDGRSGDVVELNPDTGDVVREVATGIECPTGLAVDPRTGDLFVSEVHCVQGVLRVSTSGRVSSYFAGVNVDGMAFSPDGTLYVAHRPDRDGYSVSSVAGTGSSDPGARTPIAKIPEADGIAIAASDATTGNPPFLIVNRRDGTISRIDLSKSGHPSRALVTGGSRGDFVVVGNDGCLYATQSREVLKVTNADGSCRGGSGGSGGLGDLVPTATPYVPSASAFVSIKGGAAQAKSCVRSRRLTVRFRAPKGVRVTRARLYIGKKRVRTVSGRALRRRVTLTKLPTRAFTLIIRARTSKGRSIVVRRRYKACAGVAVKPKKKSRR
jgi:hypothetical protein